MNTNEIPYFKQTQEILIKEVKEDIDSFLCLDLIFSITSESFYIVELKNNKFCFVSPGDFLLCGYSLEEALKLGDSFFRKIIHPDDYPLWEKMYMSVIQYLNNNDKNHDEVDFFSCTFRLQQKCSFLSDHLSIMTLHKMRPIWNEDVLCLLICSVENTIVKETGNLRVYHKNGKIYEEYDNKKDRWVKKMKYFLTEREMAILMLAKQGMIAKEIAIAFYREYKTIDKQITIMYNKLGVHSMLEACILFDNYKHY